MHLGLSNLKHITLYTSHSTSWLLVLGHLCSSHLNVQKNESLRCAPCFRTLRFHCGSRFSPLRTPSVRLRIYRRKAATLPRRESFRYIHSYQICTWKKEKCMLNLEQRVKIKNGSHSKILLIVGARGVGVKILMDYGGEK